jgi:anti-sigma B factor antagonist
MIPSTHWSDRVAFSKKGELRQGQRLERRISLLAEFRVEPISRPDHPSGCFVITVTGEVDLQSGQPFRAAIGKALARRPTRLVIDLTATTFLDSTGINALVLAHKAAADAATPLVLLPGPPAVMKPLIATGVIVLFDQLNAGEVRPYRRTLMAS